MILAACPYCYHGQTITEDQWGDTVKCPVCANFFDTDTPELVPSPVTDATPPEVPRVIPKGYATSLTAPHVCHQCSDPLNVPTGVSRSTILCPWCHRKTSIYAVIHYCPWCQCLLESPERRSGGLDPCPACKRKVRIPRNVLLKRGTTPPEGERYAFPCPACSGGLEAQTQHAGETAVCPHCLKALQVPPCGEALVRFAGPRNVAEVVGRGANTRCPTCHQLIPCLATTCPYCVRKC
jgi:hypothetical protein